MGLLPDDSAAADLPMIPSPNNSVEPTGGSHLAQRGFLSHWRLPPVAHAGRWALGLGPQALSQTL